MECAMALTINKGKSMPIGIDAGSTHIKMVQLRQIDQVLELVAARSIEIPYQSRQDLSKRVAFLRHALRDALKTHEFKSNECTLSIPAEATFLQHVKIPKLPASEIPKVLQRELQGKLPYPVEDAIIRHIVVGDVFGDGEPKQEVIVIATPEATINAYLSAVRHAKLEIVSVNVEPCAIVECFGRLFRQPTDASRTILYVDLGAETTQVVLSHGPRIVFAKNLPVGGQHLDKAVADKLDIPIEQAHTMRCNLRGSEQASDAENELYRLLDAPMDHLVHELTLCLHYYDSIFRNQSVERAIFLGGQAHDKRLCQTIAKKLNLPAQVGDPLLRIQRAPNIALPGDQPQPDWAVAVGLGLGGTRAA
jgi:type IV pilus assembly protein PilM